MGVSNPQQQAAASPDLSPLLARLESELRQARREAQTAYNDGRRDAIEEGAAETRRWRQAYEKVTALLDEALTDQPGLVERLDQALRGWVGRA